LQRLAHHLALDVLDVGKLDQASERERVSAVEKICPGKKVRIGGGLLSGGKKPKKR
jgi:hypothetical protein